MQMLDGFAWACEFGHRDVVSFLFERGVDVAAKVKEHGETGLHWAAGGGHVDTVAELLRHGAPVSAQDDHWGGTPIQWALHGYANRHQPPRVPADPQLLAALGS